MGSSGDVVFGIATRGEISVSGKKPADARLARPGGGTDETLGVALTLITVERLVPRRVAAPSIDPPAAR